jgi:hypothetical protein
VWGEGNSTHAHKTARQALAHTPSSTSINMLLGHVAGLSRARIVLASGSPRRRELLGSMGLKFEVCVSTFEETLPHDAFKRADEYAVETGAFNTREGGF